MATASTIKRMFLAPFIIGLLLTLPIAPAHAQVEERDYQSLLNMVGWLGNQLAALREQLYANSISTEVALPPVGTYVSTYHNGEYIAIYRISPEGIVLNTGYENGFHKNVWDMFVRIAGEHMVLTRLYEFRVYYDENARFAAYIDQIPGTDKWILGINAADIDPSDVYWEENAAVLLTHEFGHLELYYQQDTSNAFYREFWNSEMEARAVARNAIESKSERDSAHLAYFERHRDEFVSDYAVVSREEDLVESFTSFIAQGPSDTNNIRDQKRNFFSEYESMIEMRVRIRSNVPELPH